MKPPAPGLMQIPDYICYKFYGNHHSEYVLFHFLTSFIILFYSREGKRRNEKSYSLEILERLQQITHAVIWQLLVQQ
jgi:hypothetical protein